MQAGIPHSQFLGWDEDDQDKTLAFLRVDNDRCPGCRNPMTQTTDFDRRMDWQVETVTCHACRTREASDRDLGPGEFAVVTARSDRG